MEKIIYFEDIVSIALLYIYGQNSSVILSYDKAVNYFRAVKNNLDQRGVVAEYRNKNNKSDYYYIGKDESGVSYCIVDPRNDLSKIVSTGRISTDIMIASQDNNALNIIGLEFRDGQIMKLDEGRQRSIIPQ